MSTPTHVHAQGAILHIPDITFASGREALGTRILEQLRSAYPDRSDRWLAEVDDDGDLLVRVADDPTGARWYVFKDQVLLNVAIATATGLPREFAAITDLVFRARGIPEWKTMGVRLTADLPQTVEPAEALVATMAPTIYASFSRFLRPGMAMTQPMYAVLFSTPHEATFTGVSLQPSPLDGNLRLQVDTQVGRDDPNFASASFETFSDMLLPVTIAAVRDFTL